MSDANKNLDKLIRSHEEEHFQRRSQELMSQLRDKMDVEANAAAIEQATHVHDPEVLNELASLGITAQTVQVMHLLPLLQVAWADGEVQAEEEELLRELAQHSGIQEGTEAGDAFEAMLKSPPSEALYEAGLSFIKALMALVPAEEAERARTNLGNLARTIAKASGGLFGVFFTVEEEEKNVLDHIAKRLEDRAGDASNRLLEKV